MATRVEFRAGNRTHMMTLSGTDQALMALSSVDIRLCQAVYSALQQPHSVARVELLSAAESLLRDVERQSDLLPYRYSFEARPIPECPPVKGTGGMHGFRINGRIHSIWGGTGRCDLEEMEQLPDGTGRVVRTIDLRGQRHLDTDDQRIKLSRRKLPWTLPEQLRSLISFLNDAPGDHVQILTTDGPCSIMDLIRRAADDDEGAEEQLFNMGAAAKQELLEKLSDPKVRKYHGTIAWILLTVFPSPESRRAVEHLVDSETDPTRKRSYLTLLASTPGAKR